MRKVLLNMNEQQKYEIIKSLVENNGNKDRAALKLGCTKRLINRLIQKYKSHGKAAFIHGNKGRKPAHTFSDSLKNEIITLYNNKYWDATFSYACELLAQHDGISISPSALTNILYNEYIPSPRSSRKTKKRMAKELRAMQKNSNNKKDSARIQRCIVSLEHSHSRRPRCTYFGEMLQMDASLHHCFGNSKSQLHIAIDDATGMIVGAYFDGQETLNGYYNVFHQILTQYGIPAMFYTDRRTVFEYKKKKTNQIEHDTFTQFSYACHQLGVDLKTTSVAQAKGRVERAFQTLQQRLPIAMRLAGIQTIEQANVFLNSYIKEYNAKFAFPEHSIKSVFEVQPESDKINQILAVLTERVVDSGHCIRFEKKYYKTMDACGLQTHFPRGTKGLVVKTFDGQLLFSTNEQVYELEVVPEHEKISKSFDIQPAKETPRKRNIPSARHPWRSETFLKYKCHKLTDKMLAF